MHRRALLVGAGIAAGLAAMPRGAAFALGQPRREAWLVRTRGGRGGRRVAVTHLGPSGPGSLRDALEQRGPRTVEFKVGGTIDLGREPLRIREPHLTLDAARAPSPGITLIRGGLIVATHDVILRHLAIRPGEAGAARQSGWECDGVTVLGHHVEIDHCSLSWATDENLSASGPRFDGDSVEAWRLATAHAVTFSHNLIAEGLSRSTHAKGEHSKGSLVHDNVTDIAIVRNVYAHNRQRNALFKGGTRGVFANNLVYNPGDRAVHCNLHASEWRGQPWQRGQLAVLSNIVQGGPDTDPKLAVMMYGGDGEFELMLAGNLGLTRNGGSMPSLRSFRETAPAPIEVTSLPFAPDPARLWPVQTLEARLLEDCGARPWARDPIDQRIIETVRNRTGRIIDAESEVGGYPA